MLNTFNHLFFITEELLELSVIFSGRLCYSLLIIYMYN